MSLLLDMLSWILLVGGGLLVLTGGIGLLRLPDLFTRMHAASLTDTGGLLLVVFGLALQSGWTLPTAKLAAILIFLLFTAPAASYALANAALLAAKRSPEKSGTPKTGGTPKTEKKA